MTKRYAEVDVIKAVGILTVILIHSMRPPWLPETSPAEIWLGGLTRFAVPGFLAASGFLYATPEPVPWKATWHRLRRILIPYLLASVAAQVFLAVRGEGREAGTIATDLLLGSSFGPFYFVFLIVVLVLATPVFARLPHRVLVALLLLLLSSQIYGIVRAGLTDGSAANVFSSPWIVRDPRFWWSYFLLGWMARRNYEGLSAWIAARRTVSASALLLVVASLGFLTALDLSNLATQLSVWLNILAILMLIFALSSGLESVPAPLRFLSEATLPMYLFHLFFVYSFEDLVPHARRAMEPMAVLVPWTAGVAGSLLVLVVGRVLLGRRSRVILGA